MSRKLQVKVTPSDLRVAGAAARAGFGKLEDVVRLAASDLIARALTRSPGSLRDLKGSASVRADYDYKALRAGVPTSASRQP